MTALPTLLTDRLRLRPWTKDDAPAFHGIWGDPRVIWWGNTESPAASRRKLDEVLARCAAMPEGLGWWAVEMRDSLGVVGNVVLQPAPYNHTIELGYHFAHDAWGRGYATEAARGALRYAFFTLALPVVSAVVQVDNHASHRVAARVGLRAKGTITYNGLPHRLYELRHEEALTLGGIRENLKAGR
ncbi:MAG: GNAT family N-acetyltransferase [SAR324 cluster bacterium]|nr:GNAT family N-acetyltransferase [SAR324 cluster bacterium]